MSFLFSGWTGGEDRWRNSEMLAFSGGEQVWVSPSSSDEASTIGSYLNAVRSYMAGEDDDALDAFYGVMVGDVELETDAEVLNAMAYAGLLDTDDVYRENR